VVRTGFENYIERSCRLLSAVNNWAIAYPVGALLSDRKPFEVLPAISLACNGILSSLQRE
jgi:hypothetical protein